MCIRDLSPAFCAYEIPVTHKCNNSQVLYISDYVISKGINLLCLLSYLSCCCGIRRLAPVLKTIMSDFGGHRVFVSHSARTLPVFLIPKQVAESP